MPSLRRHWLLNESSGGAVRGRPVFGFAQALPPEVRGVEYAEPEERIAWVGGGQQLEWEDHRPDIEIISRQR